MQAVKSLLNLSVILVLVCISFGSNAEKIVGYEIKIVLETTSDWTDLTFDNTNFYYLKERILTPHPVSIGLLSISKNTYDSTLTKIEFDLFFPQPLPPELKFSVRKGGIGSTKIAFINTEQETLGVFVNDKNIPYDVQNLMSFSFKSRLFSGKDTIIINPDKLNTEKLVLAFYFLWYYPENWHWTGKLSIAHQPVFGLYSSSNERILKTHINMAKSAGIDGFICSWWGINSVSDQNLKKLASICNEIGFLFTVYLEKVSDMNDLRTSLCYLESTYTQQSAYIKYQGKPVIFIFNRILETIPLDSLRTVNDKFAIINYGYRVSNLEGFDGYHEFLPPETNMQKLKRLYRLARDVANSKNRIFAIPVMPGFDDRSVNEPGTLIKRKNGEYYKQTWESALSANPDWILISTFNEWFEGSEIEPSKEYGELYLKLTKQYIEKFKHNKYQ
ncbi:MAG: glycoside hydrolase family 99-like domain-containing protein [candidate division WOR-3 bacterium]